MILGLSLFSRYPLVYLFSQPQNTLKKKSFFLERNSHLELKLSSKKLLAMLWTAFCFGQHKRPRAAHSASEAVLILSCAEPLSPASQQGSAWKVSDICSDSPVQHAPSSTATAPGHAFPCGCFCLHHPAQQQHSSF